MYDESPIKNGVKEGDSWICH